MFTKACAFHSFPVSTSVNRVGGSVFMTTQNSPYPPLIIGSYLVFYVLNLIFFLIIYNVLPSCRTRVVYFDLTIVGKTLHVMYYTPIRSKSRGNRADDATREPHPSAAGSAANQLNNAKWRVLNDRDGPEAVAVPIRRYGLCTKPTN